MMSSTTHDPAILDQLIAHYPAFQQVLPLAISTKQRLAEMAATLGVDKPAIQRAIEFWTHTPAYLSALVAPGAMRCDLEGQPVQPVSPAHQTFAADLLAGRVSPPKPKKKPPKPAPASTALTPDLLAEILTMAIPGKLDVTLKINQLPVVKSLGQTVAFAVQAEGRTVLVELKTKAWNNLKTAAESYPQWVAAITGKLGEAIEGGFRLENPAVQTFERKAKPDAATTASQPVSAPVAPPPVAPASSTAAPASPTTPKPFGSTLSLKAKVEQRGS